MSSRMALILGVVAVARPAAPAASPDAADLAKKIDKHLAAAWDKAGVKPAPAADRPRPRTPRRSSKSRSPTRRGWWSPPCSRKTN